MVVLCLPLVSVFSVSADEINELDFYIFLGNPAVQMVVDEIIESAEAVGLSVNPIYYDDWAYFTYLITYTTDWDLWYGGNLGNNIPDTIFQIAYGNMGLHYFYLKHTDAKYAEASVQLWMWLQQVMADPSIITEDFINDMVDKFHDAEERLWEKQLVITLAEFLNNYDELRNLILTPNCLPGHPLADEDLRLEFSHAIDRTVAVDYCLGLGLPYSNVLYHLYGCSIYHNTDLPNCLPT